MRAGEAGMDDGHPLVPVVQHFLTKGLLVVGVWGVKHVLWRRSRHKSGLAEDKSYQIIAQPGLSFKPAPPWWLVEACRDGDPDYVDISQLDERFKEEYHEQFASNPDFQPGGGALRSLFALDPSWHHLNHGSYGATFRFALTLQTWWQQRQELQPIRFFESEVFPAMRAAVREVAALIGAEPADVVALANATSAVNIVVNSMDLCQGDLLLMTSITYPAVKNTLARAAARSGAGLLEVQLPLGVLRGGDGAIVGAFKRALAAGKGRVRLAVIDHIASFPPITFPVAELCAACRAVGAKVLVDGAHAVGARALDVPALGAHFYTSNLHKWLCTPKGSALLWVARAEQPRVLPPTTSHGYGLGFQGEFQWPGTSNFGAWLAVPAALRVWRALGEGRVRAHNHALLLEAVALLTKAFGTRDVLGADAEDACMAAVELPPGLPLAATVPDALFLQNELRRRVRVEVPIACLEGKLWVRISAQYYNTLEDYSALAEGVQQIMAEGGPSGDGQGLDAPVDRQVNGH